MSSIAHLALDGRHATVASETADLAGAASSVGIFRVDGKRQEFTAGTRELIDALTGIHGVPVVEEFSFQGGTLVLHRGASLAGPVCVTTWLADGAAVMTAFYNEVSTAQAVAQLNRFQFGVDATTRAATVTPRNPAATPIEDAAVIAKDVSNLGLLVIAPLTRAQARALPRWRGTRVRGGELFVDAPGAREMHFILANDSSVTTVMPKHSLLDGNAVPAPLEDLTVAVA